MNESKTQTIQHGKVTVVIHRPILTKEETAKRERQVQTVLESTMKSYIARKEQTA